MPDRLEIKYLSPDDLTPYDGNARTHSDAQINEIAKSIAKNGWTNPILLDGNDGIIAGHGRLLAAKKLGMDLVPTINLQFASDAEKAQYIIADNKLALNAGWDLDVLNVQFDFIEDAGLDLTDTGFSEDELKSIRELTFNEGLCDEDEVPEISESPKTKMGDVWILGEHRLMCGDSTMIDQVDKLMNDEKADMVFTDPPYGVNFEQGKFISPEKKGKNRNFEPIANDDKKGKDLEEFIKQCLVNALVNCNTSSIYIWSQPLIEGFYILSAAIEAGWNIQSQIIWNKSRFVIGRADYHWKHEVCWYGYKGKNHQWYGGRDKSTVWDVNKIVSSDLHPTMKPIELAEKAIINSTQINNAILDIFGGSGSTIIACEKTNRKCFMMEISPLYCDIIVNRWQKFSGKKAILESTQQEFDKVAYG